MKERCQIVENAKELAKEKGFDQKQVRCGVDDICTGAICLYDGRPAETIPTQTDKFFSKLEKWEEKNSPATPRSKNS